MIFPVRQPQNRHLTRQGMLADLTHVTHGHTIKMGVEAAYRVCCGNLWILPSPTPKPQRKLVSARRPWRSLPTILSVSFEQVTRGTEAVYIQDDFSPLRNLTSVPACAMTIPIFWSTPSK